MTIDDALRAVINQQYLELHDHNGTIKKRGFYGERKRALTFNLIGEGRRIMYYMYYMYFIKSSILGESAGI